MLCPSWFHVGVFLYTSCSAEWWGPVTRIGKDSNGRDVVDFEMDADRVNDFLDTTEDSENKPSLADVAFPEGTRCIFRDVPIERIGDEQCDPESRAVVLKTPGNGCYRCTSLFFVHERME
jgi:hypothetical protein